MKERGILFPNLNFDKKEEERKKKQEEEKRGENNRMIDLVAPGNLENLPAEANVHL